MPISRLPRDTRWHAEQTGTRRLLAWFFIAPTFLLSCSKIGTIEGVGLNDCHSEGDSVSLVVKFEDGRKVQAGRGKDNNQGLVTGGQRVKVTKVAATKSGDECWEVVEWLK